MPREQLRRTVEQLHSELETGKALSAEQRQTLSDALSEIETMLESDESPLGETHSIAERLRDAGARFEDSHPSLTIAVGAVADALSKIGI